MEDKKIIAKNIGIATLVTIGICAIIGIYVGSNLYLLGRTAGFLVGILFGVIVAFLNTLFILLLSFTKSGKIIFTNSWITLIEVALMFGAFILVGQIIELVPMEFKFYKTPTITAKRIWFDELRIIYPFIVMFLIFLSTKKYLVKRISRRSENL